MEKSKIKDIVSMFAINGTVKEITPLGNGWINDTYKVATNEMDAPDYVLQRINHNIFKDVDLLQDNIVKATTHIRKKLETKGESEIDRKVITVIPSLKGENYVIVDGEYWRIILFIDGAVTLEEVSEKNAYYAGKAFGEFQAMLSDIDSDLAESIPNFHNIEFRLQGLHEVIAKNPAGRLEKVQWMVNELLDREKEMCKAEEWHRNGLLPKRITHCDTKVNNMLFDEKSGDVLCVIDLDTTMPNFVFSDFGDFIRTAGNTGAEDDTNLDNVGLNFPIFKAFAEGYVESGKQFLLPIEIDNLPFGAKLLTYMQTVRFLADYIDGDKYYKVKSEEHNWERSLAQFKLLQSIEENEEKMLSFIQDLIRKTN